MALTILLLILFLLLLLLWSRKYKSNDEKSIEFWNKVETMFQETSTSDVWSANRVAYIFTMVLSNLVMWGGILFLAIHLGAFPDVPQGVILIYGISNGVASIAKVWQKREERFEEEASNKDTKDKPPVQ